MRRWTLPGQAPSRYPPWMSRRAAVVGWFWCHVLRYGGELCQACGRPYGRRFGIWWSRQELWEQVREGFPQRISLLCPGCFTKAADRLGVLVVWVATSDAQHPLKEPDEARAYAEAVA